MPWGIEIWNNRLEQLTSSFVIWCTNRSLSPFLGVNNFGDFRDCVTPFHPSFSEEFSNNYEGTLFVVSNVEKNGLLLVWFCVHHFDFLWVLLFKYPKNISTKPFENIVYFFFLASWWILSFSLPLFIWLNCRKYPWSLYFISK